MRFPVLVTYRLPPPSIHGHNHGTDPYRFDLPDFECFGRRDWNVEFLTSRLRCEEGVANRFPVIRRQP
jgi:hypothetical protein